MMDQFCTSTHPHPARMGGVQKLYKFPNGYGASVVQSPFTYGGDKGLWELAVLDSAGQLDYSTPITSDVEGYLTWTDVEALLQRIARLESAAAP